VNDWTKISAKLRAQLQQETAQNEQSRRCRAAKFPEFEQALALKFRQQEARDPPIIDEMLCGQAKLFGPHFNVPEIFAYSDGWLVKLKKRQGIKQIVKHGEANAADSHGAKLACEAIPKIVKDGGYATQDIYNQMRQGSSGGSCRSVRWQKASEQAERKASSASRCLWAAIPLPQASASCL
jgi:hypothetical protein